MKTVVLTIILSDDLILKNIIIGENNTGIESDKDLLYQIANAIIVNKNMDGTLKDAKAIINSRMTKDQWIQKYKDNKQKFEWFIKKYIRDERIIEKLDDLVSHGDAKALYTNLNYMWSELPDDIFNIQVRPWGWLEFLDVIESFEQIIDLK